MSADRLNFSGMRTPDLSLSTSRISVVRGTMGKQKFPIQSTPMALKGGVYNDSPFSTHGVSPVVFSDTTNESFECIIRRLIDTGDFASATHWIDAAYAREDEVGTSTATNEVDLVKLAKYVRDLTTVREFLRVAAILESEGYFEEHLVFAYYYVNSLYQRKMYDEVLQCPVGYLIEGIDDPNVPFKAAPEGSDATFRGTGYSFEDKKSLDEMAVSLKLNSAILLIYGQTFLVADNREAASKCLLAALTADRTCITAEQLLISYKLLPSNIEQSLADIGRVESEDDPRVRSSLAKQAYSRGNANKALRYTIEIIKEHGLYLDCLLVHINALVQLEDSNALFLLAHRLVDSLPNHELSWYCVGMYYYVCKSSSAARNFMNKVTTMNPRFGEGWLAFGHVLASESENEQALNCYYKAARILERHYEPMLYIAMQYCKSGVKLADQFLSLAAKNAPNNPIVIHEQGSLAYNKRDFPMARSLFENALRLLLKEQNLPIEVNESLTGQYLADSLRKSPIDPFWESLINNLGHCARRIGLFEESITYHERALLMTPKNVNAITSLAMSHASMGQLGEATGYFHRALSIDPYDEFARSGLNMLIKPNGDTLAANHVYRIPDTIPDIDTLEGLEALLITVTPYQLQSRDPEVRRRTRDREGPLTRSAARNRNVGTESDHSRSVSRSSSDLARLDFDVSLSPIPPPDEPSFAVPELPPRSSHREN